MDREKVVSNLFDFIFGFWCISDIILRTAFEAKINSALDSLFRRSGTDIDKVIDVTVLFALIILIFFLQKYTRRELYILAFITVPMLVATLYSNNNFMISMLLFIVGAKYADLDNIIKMFFYILLLSIPIVVFFCLIGVLPDYTMYRGNQIRHALGFEHPNRLGMRLFQLMACLCYIDRTNNHPWLKYFFLLSTTWFVYRVPNSQTAYIGILILLVLVMIGNVYDNHNVSKKRLMTGMTVLSVFINIGTVLVSLVNPRKNAFLNTIDKVLSHRFLYGYRMYKYYGISLLGQDVQTMVKDSKYVGVYRQWYLDNAYLSILLRFGVIVYILFSVLWVATIIYYVRNEHYMMVVILFTYSVYGIMTTGFYMMSHNIFLLTMSSMIFQKKLSDNSSSPRRIRLVWRLNGGPA